MALLEDKIDQIPDMNLRETIMKEIRKLKTGKQFGLVFEQHIPEVVPIFSATVRKGSVVAMKTGNMRDTYIVAGVNGNEVELKDGMNEEIKTVPLEMVTVVKRFGEPIFPSLIKQGEVINSEDPLHHILIESDNYHALQLLEYIYPKKLDCIYIDPPYNTGARDWKYNNNYVDDNDAYRHSKWLSMMQKRLTLSKQLLKDDGVLILTIDDYELYHVGTLLEEIFPEYDHYIITIEHNRRGRRGKNFAKTNEYAIFLVPKGREIIQEEILQEAIGGETRNLRRTGSGSMRHQRWRKFYPIFVNKKTLEVIGAGDSLPLGGEPSYEEEGDIVTIWPIDEDGREKNWHYGVTRTREAIKEGKLEAREQSYGIQVYYTLREKKSRRVKTVWSKSTLDASTYGTELLNKILGNNASFDFPKSIYSVKDCIKAVVGNREDAVILDFFAGSGTTLHSVMMLNEELDSNHQCILVTNNEVSGEEAERLQEEGFYPGEEEWERNGICRSVTFPRVKNVTLGRREDGTEIEGEYLTGKYITREKPRSIKQLGFVGGELNATKKKQIAALIDGVPQSKIKGDTKYFVDENSEASILFDPDSFESFLAELGEHNKVKDIYIVVQKPSDFRKMKAAINEEIGPIYLEEESKKLYSEGFSANISYFKLDFLDSDEVALGLQFESLLPILWMISGAKGKLPDVDCNENYFLGEGDSSFAILFREKYFGEFLSKLNQKEMNIDYIFIISNSEEAFFDMKDEISNKNVYMLYKNYLKNFEINRFARGR